MVTKRVEPYSKDAEMGFLGAVLLGNPYANKHLRSLKATDFHWREHKWIYLAAKKIKGEADFNSIYHQLKKDGMTKEAGGTAYMKLLTGCVGFRDPAKFLRIIKSRTRIRLRRKDEACCKKDDRKGQRK
jgi:replicative DNA helicase